MHKQRVPYDRLVSMMEGLNRKTGVFQPVDIEEEPEPDAALERSERHKYINYYSIGSVFSADLSTDAFDDKIAIFRDYYFITPTEDS